MNLFKLSWKNIIHRKLSSGLSILLLASGISTILITLLTTHQLNEKFERNIQDIDLVVGASGSKLQILLCNIFQIDNPTGNILKSKADAIADYPMVEKAVPVSMGDNYQGHRIVGTTPDYIDLFHGKIEEGEMWSKPLDAVVGRSLADKFHLRLGSNFLGGHGLDLESSHIHANMKYTVVGILEKNNTVLDNLVLTPLESVWLVHAGEDHGSEGSLELNTNQNGEKKLTLEDYNIIDSLAETGLDFDSLIAAFKGEELVIEDTVKIVKSNEQLLAELDESAKEVTGVLITVKAGSARAKISTDRYLNGMEGVSATDVAVELKQLQQLMSPGTIILQILAYIIIIIAGISLFVSMFNSLKDRQYEIALMRVMGSSKIKIFGSILMEGIYLSLIGFIFGWLLSHIGMHFLSDYLSAEYRYDFSGWVFISAEIWLLAGALLIGIISAIYPGIKAYRTDISETLSK